jgi:hypothetical protein
MSSAYRIHRHFILGDKFNLPKSTSTLYFVGIITSRISKLILTHYRLSIILKDPKNWIIGLLLEQAY